MDGFMLHMRSGLIMKKDVSDVMLVDVRTNRVHLVKRCMDAADKYNLIAFSHFSKDDVTLTDGTVYCLTFPEDADAMILIDEMTSDMYVVKRIDDSEFISLLHIDDDVFIKDDYRRNCIERESDV